MKVTSIRVNVDLDKSRARKESSELIAFASIVLDGVLVISNIRVIRVESGKVIVSMPSRQSPSGQYRDLVYPIDADFRIAIDKAVTGAVDEAIARGVK